ncbi:helix-turn-helix transcriptional regulator [Peptoniphilus catoniae]|uniref:helix-turn-helix transcriptional regulator n=1 Tax=Peptoniphilus catoniae TaxID=1660341 RepID=UPI0010FDFA82|nr:helix-turn-helix transcriptional regulator [Peptoniphilus catoniae]
MDLTNRQLRIIEIVKKEAPITGDEIANKLGLSRATIRPDLTILTMLNILGARPKVGYFYTGKNEFNNFSKQVKKILVRDTMSVPVVMDENISIYDVIVGLFLDNMGSVFITSEGYLAGVVSRKDLLRSALGKLDLQNTPVGLIMTRMPNIAYVTEETSIIEAAKLIEEKEVDSLPVVRVAKENRDKLKVVGRFTKTNINNLFVELARED